MYEMNRGVLSALHEFTVGVFPHRGKRRTRYMAYTRDYNSQWKGCCEHRVTALSGTVAKQLAIKEHMDGVYRTSSGIENGRKCINQFDG
jgi:hypothetical protein